jgi:hypothetical protein
MRFPPSLTLLALLALAFNVCPAEEAMLHLPARSRPISAQSTSQPTEQILDWNARKTALVICDMWDTHTCPNAASRVGELAPKVNEFAKVLRARGVFIIHCPSDTMAFYKEHPGRKLAQDAPKSEPPVPLQRWCYLDTAAEAIVRLPGKKGIPIHGLANTRPSRLPMAMPSPRAPKRTISCSSGGLKT